MMLGKICVLVLVFVLIRIYKKHTVKVYKQVMKTVHDGPILYATTVANS